jgi:hypothetical protein
MPAVALTPAQNEALIREVDDAVRQDSLVSFWRGYGKLVIGLIIGGLAAFAGFLLWQNHQKSQAERASDAFARLLASANTNRIDPAERATIEGSGSIGYSAAVKLAEAAIALRKNDIKTAANAYHAVVTDESAPQPYRDVALIRQTAAEFDALKPDVIIARLKPLAVTGNPWFGSAGELTAIAHLKAGRAIEAAAMLAAVVRDPAVPQTIKLRAAQLAGTLGVDTVLPATAQN